MTFGIYNPERKKIGTISCDSLYAMEIGNNSNFYVRTGEDGEIVGSLNLAENCYVEVES